MENSNNNPQNTDNNSHPKPTDEIHLTIETVTPDTEKEGQPNDQKNNHSLGKIPSEDATENINNDKDTEDKNSHEDADSSEKPQAAESKNEDTNEEKPAEENNPEPENEDADKKESGDQRDEIETTSV